MMKNVEEKMSEHFDTGSIIIILITFVLFVAALFTKGFTHNLLLEAGVFLVFKPKQDGKITVYVR